MNKPFLSIITINYNDLKGLEKTVSSVMEQTLADFEYLIIDGGSNDGSLELIEQHQEQLSYWVSERDSGVYNAMNKGIAAAKGTYLLFLNSGDILTSKTALEDFIGQPSFSGDIIYGDYKFEKGEKVYPDELTPYYFMRTSLPHQSTFFKRTVFDRMGNYNENYKIAADRAFYIKCFMNGQIRFQHITYALTKFDLSGMSNDPGLLKKKAEEDEAVFKKYFGIHYPELAKRRDAEAKQKRMERNSFTGVLKRIKRRLSS